MGKLRGKSLRFKMDEVKCVRCNKIFEVNMYKYKLPTPKLMHYSHLPKHECLSKKDIEFMKALEADDGSHTAIAAEKQTLRDIPQTFDLTTDTPEELKEKWPEGLPKE